MTAAVVENETATTEAVEEDNTPADYSAFEAVVGNISLADAGNPESDSVKAAQEVYGELDAKSKRAARKWLKDTGEKFMLNDEFEKSKLFILVRKYAAVAPAGSGGTGSSRKTPEQKLIENFRAIHLGYQVVATLVQNTPGIDFTAIQPAEVDITPALTYREWLESGAEGDEPEVDTELKKAARISLGRGPNGQGRKPGSKAKTAEDNAEAGEPEVDDESADPTAE